MNRPRPAKTPPGPRDHGGSRTAGGRKSAAITGRTSLAALALLAAACGSTGPAASPAGGRPPATRSPLLTSLSARHGAAWAILEVGGSRAEHNNFWQLLVRPAAGQPWRLATPPGVADNGGLITTGSPSSTTTGDPGSTAGPGSTGTSNSNGQTGFGADGSSQAGSGGTSGTTPGLVAGFVPSQDLTFSPLALSRDGGRHWSPGLLPAGLAASASALAAGAGGRLLALTGSGVQRSGPGGTAWKPLVSTAALAASPAGRSCGLTGLTAVAFGSAGAPLLAGSCSRPGITGIFTLSGGHWELAGPKPPQEFTGRPVTVVQLTTTAPGQLTALLTAGPGTGLAVAWSGDGKPWTTSAPLPPAGRRLVSTATGSDGTAGVILTGGQAAIIRPPGTSTPPGTGWTTLPALPAEATKATKSADLVLGPGRQVSVLTATRTTVTAWLLSALSPGASWSPGQKLTIPVPFGSSG